MIDQVSPGAFGDQLRRIVPRLFRYRFDPSAKTRSAMEQLWRSIVGGGGRGVAADFSIREKEVCAVYSRIYPRFLLGHGSHESREANTRSTAPCLDYVPPLVSDPGYLDWVYLEVVDLLQ